MIQTGPRRSVRYPLPFGGATICGASPPALLILLALSLLALAPQPAWGQDPVTDYRLNLVIRDDQGTSIPARVRIFGSDGHCHPESLDVVRMTHNGSGGYYFYADGQAWVNVPGGPTRVTVGRGFEYRSTDTFLYVSRDTTLQITLPRWVDLGQDGWFSGDMHTHTQHFPLDYVVTPGIAKRVARSEGLSVVHILDNEYQFTGAPHVISDAETILYYTVEYRNQTYGHFGIPGLREFVFPHCCFPPEPCYPMIMDVRQDLVPDLAHMVLLAHPHSTDDYFYEDGWPGAGLGRELPVLAALGQLDALDVVSYGNDPYEDWEDWYDVLSCGVPCPASAGTDARPQSYTMAPIGGWRVYARIPPGDPLDYDSWVEGLRAGRTFITNYPLIPEFTVNGVAPGDSAIHVDGDEFQPTIRIRALCSIGLTRLILQADGQQVWSANVATLPITTEVDTTFTVDISTPGWMNLIVLGRAGNPHAALGPPQAQTSAVMIHKNGSPTMRTEPAGRFLDDLTNLRTFVLERGNWYTTWHRDTVLTRIFRSEGFYRRAFVVPPNPFSLLDPQDGDTLQMSGGVLAWEESIDPEGGDLVAYTVTLSQDSLFAHPIRRKVTGTSIDLSQILLGPGYYYWYVVATDRGNNERISTPERSGFFLASPNSSAGDAAQFTPSNPRAWPNPSFGPVHLDGFAGRAAIYDVSGRRIAWVGRGIQRSGEELLWDGTIDAGRRAPPGIYWARGRRGDPVRLIQLR